MKRTTFLISATAILLSGCAEANSIYRKSQLNSSNASVITVDAKQRFLLSQIEKAATTPSAQPAFRRFCAEPSPDTFSVLSQAASGSGSLGLDSSAKTLNAAVQAAFANSETGKTIPRTQTINMLREMMYRTCERFLSGAISSTELPIVNIRDQRVMVSILAIEQLTGAIAPKPVIISNGSTAGTGQNAEKIMATLAKARDQRQQAAAALTEAQTKLTAANTAAGTDGCDKLANNEAVKKKACTDAAKEVSNAETARDEAEAYFKQQSQIAANNQGESTASASPGPATDPKEWTLAQAKAVTAVSTAVENIVAQTFDQDETQFFCFRQISNDKVVAETKLAESTARIPPSQTLQSACLDYITQKVKADTASQEKRARQLGATGASVTEIREATRRANEAKDQNVARAEALALCVLNPDKAKAITVEIGKNAGLKDWVDTFNRAIKQGEASLVDFVTHLPFEGNGSTNPNADFDKISSNICRG